MKKYEHNEFILSERWLSELVVREITRYWNFNFNFHLKTYYLLQNELKVVDVKIKLEVGLNVFKLPRKTKNQKKGKVEPLSDKTSNACLCIRLPTGAKGHQKHSVQTAKAHVVK